MSTTQEIKSTSRLPDVQYQYVSGMGTQELWTALALAAGFPNDLSNDHTWLLGLCIAETCQEFMADDNLDLPKIVSSFSELQKSEVRCRASRRACSRAFVRAV
jgi:hypothetical protein